MLFYVDNKAYFCVASSFEAFRQEADGEKHTTLLQYVPTAILRIVLLRDYRPSRNHAQI